MNQYILIRYKPTWNWNPNYWDIWFVLNSKHHREKAPNWLDSYGCWDWRIHDIFQNKGDDFDWNKHESMD